MLNISIISHDLRACIKNLGRYPRPEQRKILEKLAFDFYLRKGAIPPQLAALQKLAATAKPSFKFNPYHDELGRFTFAPGGGEDDETDDNGDDSGNDTTLVADPGAGDMRLVQEEIPPDLPFEDEIPVTPKPPFDKLPQDPTRPPGPGYQWEGNGPPKNGGQGNWHNEDTDESLHPDMDHLPPEGPHWDYRAPDGRWWRWYPDGRMEPKSIAGGEIA